jgi:hypothetical protein
MGEYQYNESGSRSSSGSQSEIGRDGLSQSVLGYYASGPGHDPQPDPMGYEAGNDIPPSSKVAIAIFAAVGIVVAFLQWNGQL